MKENPVPISRVKVDLHITLCWGYIRIPLIGCTQPYSKMRVVWLGVEQRLAQDLWLTGVQLWCVCCRSLSYVRIALPDYCDRSGQPYVLLLPPRTFNTFKGIKELEDTMQRASHRSPTGSASAFHSSEAESRSLTGLFEVKGCMAFTKKPPINAVQRFKQLQLPL
jgi:hypothetical protein